MDNYQWITIYTREIVYTVVLLLILYLKGRSSYWKGYHKGYKHCERYHWDSDNSELVFLRELVHKDYDMRLDSQSQYLNALTIKVKSRDSK